MENAAKALLIGGCITLSVLIVSLGIYVVRANDTTDDASSLLNSMEIRMHNAKYETYEGLQSGSEVKTILNYAIEDNAKLEGEERKWDTINICINITSTYIFYLNAKKHLTNVRCFWRRTRDSNPRTSIIQPTPLAGEPL